MSKKGAHKKLLVVFLFCFLGICLIGANLKSMKSYAQDQNVYVTDDEDTELIVHIGDTGTIVPNLSDYQPYPDNGQYPVHFTYSVVSNESNITVDENGQYKAIGVGRARITVSGYSESGQTVFLTDIYVVICPDMTNVTLEKNYVNADLVANYTYGKETYYDSVEFDIAIYSPVMLSTEMEGVDVSCTSSNSDVWAEVTLTNNILHFKIDANKKCSSVLTVNISGKEFLVTVSLNPVKLSANSLILVKGHSQKLKISGSPKQVLWTSSNKKIASVSKSGVVKGKKKGNVIIAVQIENKKMGCAVSVTSSKIKKVCKRGTYIGTHWKYSQKKRTQSGYYDCSALVWKAYKKGAGFTFGDSHYPGTTDTESAWCKTHKKMVKGGYKYKNVEKMKLNPGDIVFKSTNPKKPYKTTYHVEMFTGYLCYGFDSNGKAMVTSLWAARGAGYGAEEGSLLARPMN